MSDMYLAEDACGDLTVWLVMPDGKDRAILQRTDLDIGRPLGLHVYDDKARANFHAVTEAHDRLWQAATAGLVNYNTTVWMRDDDFDWLAQNDGDFTIEQFEVIGTGSENIWHQVDGFNPADFTDPDLIKRKGAVV